jgi:FkbM family methyltransferase
MTFISYARNYEDVMLWRALGHIESGFYIDVGAWSPDVDSVTRAFYEHGWRGINVGRNPMFDAQLLARRPRDINLGMALSNKAGSLMTSFLGNTGLSTFDNTIAQNHARSGLAVDKQKVRVTTLADLWTQHVPEGQAVHFLKVDVEGFERAVLRGNDWSKYRPWIIVVEATLPMSQQESHEEWEPMILMAGYRFAYADGLNRFYIAEEHVELLPSFKYPPNIFDGFKLNALYLIESQVREEKVRADDAENKARELQNAVDQLNQEIQDVYSSRSWCITRPLRVVFVALLRVQTMSPDVLRPVKLFIGHQLSSIIVYMIRFARAHPTFQDKGLFWVRKYPELNSWLHRFAVARGLLPGCKLNNNMYYAPSFDSKKLTPNARCIYKDLKDAIRQHNMGDR